MGSQFINAPLAVTSAIVAHTDINSARVHLLLTGNKDVVPLCKLRISNFFVDRAL
jgi:hypothetical protein